MTITDIILEELRISKLSPLILNETPALFYMKPSMMFASRVVERMGGRSFDTFDTEPDDLGEHLRMAGQKHDIKATGRNLNHCFIVHHGRVYDAEMPHGVDEWDQLPYFVRRQYRATNYVMWYGRIIAEGEEPDINPE
jgi:hypothetical protein